jgi:hypothetical protein
MVQNHSNQLGMPEEQVLQIWQKAGRPAIPLRPGETCLDLEKFLSHPITRDSDIQAINRWIKETYRGEVDNPERQLVAGPTGAIAPAANKEAQMRTERQGQLLTEAPAGNKAPPASKTQAHIQYKLADGTVVPGVTTVLNILAKPALIQWAWDLGRQGLDWREVRDSAGDVGTLAHYFIMCTLKGEQPDTSEYSQADIQKANNCLAKFKNWLKEHPISPIMIETPLVSEEYKYGGTLDLFAEFNGEFILVDFKTGKALYDEYFYQLAAYCQLLQEQGWPVANARILRIGRDEDEGFEEGVRRGLDNEWEIFTHCLKIYQLQKSGVS